MKLFQNSEELKNHLRKERCLNKKIGFIPTMGALHDGHISLINESRKENDVTVASIFVNPLQFNNSQDLKLYPRTIENDIEKLEKAGCDVLFFPQEEDIYREKPRIQMHFGLLEEVMEGKFRPGHFNGVAIIVAKLFHYVEPDNAYFGQKDLQQLLIIRQMARDLSFPLVVHCCPIFREKDGLAMSSRNMRIPPAKRAVSAQIYQALLIGKDALLKEGVEKSKEKVQDHLSKFPDLKLEYFEVADGETLEPVKNVKEHRQVALCIAVYLGEIRLIDNIFLFS